MNPINKIEIPDWWAEILDRIGLPHGADNYLPVDNPLDDDFSDMDDFWTDLDDQLGRNIEAWIDANFDGGTVELWESTWSKTNFVLAYLNPYSKPLFETFETGVHLV